jgi:hypothetical protein
MARSPAHKFGQIIGDVLEATLDPILTEFATRHGLYLDKRGPRPARHGNKVRWTDLNGNVHDLDFVLERGGSPSELGVPVAFIETAWRRYTKHSRNKAQEIQGAIMPLVETHRRHCPFIGAVLAGVFTDGALAQLRSLGFTVAYFPYEAVARAFSAVGIDARSDERTPDRQFAKKIGRWNELDAAGWLEVSRELARINWDQISQFIASLTNVVTRTVKVVRILPLHGQAVEWANVEDAITFIQAYREGAASQPLARYEVEILYMNGDKICGEFGAKADAIEFLEAYRAPRMPEQHASGGKK